MGFHVNLGEWAARLWPQPLRGGTQAITHLQAHRRFSLRLLSTLLPFLGSHAWYDDVLIATPRAALPPQVGSAFRRPCRRCVLCRPLYMTSGSSFFVTGRQRIPEWGDQQPHPWHLLFWLCASKSRALFLRQDPGLKSVMRCHSILHFRPATSFSLGGLPSKASVQRAAQVCAIKSWEPRGRSHGRANPTGHGLLLEAP